ncbi:MAG: ankyrin repeat domain-containing protein [Planctomycetes bacterium]|nr:ankyrin repeat domain-containing protein [Planctomycetota bacterium]
MAEQRRIEAKREAQISKAVNDFINRDLFSPNVLGKDQFREVTVREVLDAASVNIKGKLRDAPLVEASIRETMAAVYTALGRYDEAAEHRERARDIYLEHLGEQDRQTIDSFKNLGLLYAVLNRFDEAELLLQKVIDHRSRILSDHVPDALHFKSTLGMMYWKMERREDAERLFNELTISMQSLRAVSDPKMFQVMNNLAGWHLSQGHYDEAKQLWIRLIDINPELWGEGLPLVQGAKRHLAMLLSACPVAQVRDGKRAVELSTHLCEQTNWTNYDFIGILAAAYAEAGDFETAAKWANEAIELLPADSDAETHRRMQKRLEQYQLREPSRFDRDLEPTEFELTVIVSNSSSQSTAYSPQIEELNRAVDSNDLKKVKDLLAADADVNAVNVLGMAPLHIATQNGYREMMERLLSHGAEVNVRNRNNETPLHIAARKNDAHSAELLLAKGAEIGVRDGNGRLPLHSAAWDGSEQVVEVLLAIGTDGQCESPARWDAAPLCDKPWPPGSGQIALGEWRRCKCRIRSGLHPVICCSRWRLYRPGENTPGAWRRREGTGWRECHSAAFLVGARPPGSRKDTAGQRHGCECQSTGYDTPAPSSPEWPPGRCGTTARQ